MQLLLIADRDEETRKQIVGFFNESEYKVIDTGSMDVVLSNVLKKEAKVILLGSEFDGFSAMKIIPLLKSCNQNLTIILISNEESPTLIRRLRKEGIFYHALKPVDGDDRKELRQVVQCAFNNSINKKGGPENVLPGNSNGEMSQEKNEKNVDRKENKTKEKRRFNHENGYLNTLFSSGSYQSGICRKLCGS